MHAASGGGTSFQNIKKSKLFENLNDAQVFRCLCFQLGNKVKMERMIMFTRNRESAF